MSSRERILVIRRDNIGDLVLTTPLIRALRLAKPDAWIGALVNTYNAPVLAGNPDLDAVCAYDKAKHQPDRYRAAVLFDTAKLLFSLRRQRMDHVILAGPGAQRQAYALARWIAPGAMTAFVTPEFAPAGITMPVAYGAGAQLHEAEDVFRLLAPCGVREESPGSAGRAQGAVAAPPPCAVYPDRAVVAQWRTRIAPQRDSTGPLVAIHLSARRIKQRWPAAHFAEAMRLLHEHHGARFVLLWSPGAADDARHPGDDAKAREVMDTLPKEFPVATCPTQQLPDLVAVLSLADAVICADGGAMHLAAGLGKPIVALFGDSPSARWRPWGVAHEVVQAPNGDVAQLAISDVLAAWERLAARVVAIQA